MLTHVKISKRYYFYLITAARGQYKNYLRRVLQRVKSERVLGNINIEVEKLYNTEIHKNVA